MITVLVLLLAVVSTAWAGKPGPPPNKDTLTVTALTSAGGIVPTLKGNSSNAQREWWYLFCVNNGAELHDSFQLQYDLTDTDAMVQTYTITAGQTGELAGDATFDPPGGGATTGSVTIPETSGGTSTAYQTVYLDTGALTNSKYVLNIQVQSSSTSTLQITHATIHIFITTNGCPSNAASSCLLTSSSYGLLNDCSNNPVDGPTGGTFTIVQNKKSIVSTNPGQFYYNLIYTNTTGDTQTVTFELPGANENPAGPFAYPDLWELLNNGTQSVHIATFSPNYCDVNDTSSCADAFITTNSTGYPCGPYADGVGGTPGSLNPCSATVEAGGIVWVTWHSVYALIGQNVSGIPKTCNATVSNNPWDISVRGVLWDTTATSGIVDPSQDAELVDCTASAAGSLQGQPY